MSTMTGEFTIGDKAVYPSQGVAEVIGIEKKEVYGKIQNFYVLRGLETGLRILVPTDKATVILVLDQSGSMFAQDLHPSRLGAAQAAVRTFLEKVPKRIRVGLIVFAGEAQVAAPPTSDHELVRASVDALGTFAPRPSPAQPPKPPLEEGSLVGRIEIPRVGVSAVVLEGSDDTTLRRRAPPLRPRSDRRSLCASPRGRTNSARGSPGPTRPLPAARPSASPPPPAPG